MIKSLKKWFTLIEMMIVILIIWILFYILIPKDSIFPSAEMTLHSKLSKLGASYGRVYTSLSSNAGIDRQTILDWFTKTIGNKTITMNNSNTNTELIWLVPKNSKTIYEKLANNFWVGTWYLSNFFKILNPITSNWDTAWYYVPWWATNIVNWNPIVDPDYGGILACAVHSKEKYAEFKAKWHPWKYLTCVALSLDWTYSIWKSTITKAFWVSALKPEETDKIPSYSNSN